MRIIVAGGRDFNDYELLKEKLDNESLSSEDTIISGDARGADRLGERYAKEHCIWCTKYPAKWDKYGKSAGYIRNAEMASNADALIAFWDGKSRGTKHMIDIADSLGLKVTIVKYGAINNTAS
jgi:hypothetical protein